MEPEQAQDEEDNDDKTDQVDDAMHGEDLARPSIRGVCGFELKPCHNDGPAAAFRPLLNKCSAGRKIDS